ncbi:MULTISPECIES: phosphotransferase [Prauserella salsuginis group]|uniref:Aminoglycoside phosphotransferase domain-containing protein n=2 Tax=Prauserella salsuginis group TaxID=2893672 RepID=A0A839XBJ1_9PSEU|nr:MULTISPECIES: phosphotransferase [Prauserella salsuginis group]MBB3661342.1 hypothetical protein [Prauserella sediminis]MCR3719264.1 Phosphotransferase enzyme family protein [Prauserella flava]MCR3735723.1 Phosphotransferase enzyme family protein [Prauserella salsuginis]
MSARSVPPRLAAVLDTARRFGVRTDEPEILASGSNLLVRLGDVVARTPGATASLRSDPGAALAREVRLAGFLARAGAPVVPPSSDPPPGPHGAGGDAVTFWRYVRHDRSAVPAPAEVAYTLEQVHAAARGYPGDLPSDGPVAEARQLLHLLGDDVPDGLRTDLDRLARAAAEAPGRNQALHGQALHGDAHPGNLLTTPRGLLWTDFEDTWFGPVAWDLAVLRRTSLLDGAAAVAAYPDAPDSDALAPFIALRRLYGVCWRMLLARGSPTGSQERRRAREALAAYLTPPDTSR